MFKALKSAASAGARALKSVFTGNQNQTRRLAAVNRGVRRAAKQEEAKIRGDLPWMHPLMRLPPVVAARASRKANNRPSPSAPPLPFPLPMPSAPPLPPPLTLNNLRRKNAQNALSFRVYNMGEKRNTMKKAKGNAIKNLNSLVPANAPNWLRKHTLLSSAINLNKHAKGAEPVVLRVMNNAGQLFDPRRKFESIPGENISTRMNRLERQRKNQNLVARRQILPRLAAAKAANALWRKHGMFVSGNDEN